MAKAGRGEGLTASPETPPSKGCLSFFPGHRAASWNHVSAPTTKKRVSMWGAPAEVRGQRGRWGHEAQPC